MANKTRLRREKEFNNFCFFSFSLSFVGDKRRPSFPSLPSLTRGGEGRGVTILHSRRRWVLSHLSSCLYSAPEMKRFFLLFPPNKKVFFLPLALCKICQIRDIYKKICLCTKLSNSGAPTNFQNSVAKNIGKKFIEFCERSLSPLLALRVARSYHFKKAPPFPLFLPPSFFWRRTSWDKKFRVEKGSIFLFHTVVNSRAFFPAASIARTLHNGFGKALRGGQERLENSWDACWLFFFSYE